MVLVSPGLLRRSAFRYILWSPVVPQSSIELPPSPPHISAFLLTGSSSAACLSYRNDLNIRARLPSDFSHQRPRSRSANHLRLEEECPSCILSFFKFFEKYLSVVFWIAGGLSWSTWISIITLRGGICWCFMMNGFQQGIEHLSCYFRRQYYWTNAN